MYSTIAHNVSTLIIFLMAMLVLIALVAASKGGLNITLRIKRSGNKMTLTLKTRKSTTP